MYQTIAFSLLISTCSTACRLSVPRFGHCACSQYRSYEKGIHQKKQFLKDVGNLSLSPYDNVATNLALQHNLYGAVLVEMKDIFPETSSALFRSAYRTVDHVHEEQYLVQYLRRLVPSIFEVFSVFSV